MEMEMKMRVTSINSLSFANVFCYLFLLSRDIIVITFSIVIVFNG